MKASLRLLLAAALSASICGCAYPPQGREVIMQTSTIGALLEGAYDGDMTFGELRRYGDFGIGTVNRLDGEMIALDGEFYQVRADGKAYRIGDSAKTPFAVVTFFEPDMTVVLARALDYEQLQESLDRALPTGNVPYAIRIDGTFSFVKTRSVPAQTKPYPRLVEVVKTQPTFEFHDVRGTMVGVRLPSYMEGVNAVGYHLHFITEDRRAGGHLLECVTAEVTVGIDETPGFLVLLPEGEGFDKIELTGPGSDEVRQVEHDDSGR